MKPDCPLCLSHSVERFTPQAWRIYWRCSQCELIFVDATQHPDPQEELAIYEQHENHPYDPGYRTFLKRLADPLIEKLPAGARGLDFGAGPGPTLSLLLEEAGFQMSLYDPYFHREEKNLQQKYNFVTATEVIEHFHSPRTTWTQLFRLVKSGGILAVMTAVRTDAIDFANWHYQRDPTHVAFYHLHTMNWLADWQAVHLFHPHPHVSFFQC